VSGRIRIGTSGWVYPPWRGEFYPRGLAHRRELEYLSRQVNSVEINGSFYALQRPSSYESWRDQTPDDFEFAVKGGRFITHMKRLRDIDAPLANFFASGVLALGAKLGPLLWQLPPTFRCDLDRLAQALEHLHDGHRHAFEFRHPSWFREETYTLLREHRVALVVGDRPQVNTFQTRELTADFTFVRFHSGTRGRNGNYSHAELDEWIEQLLRWSAEVDVYAYFNNDWEGFAIENAAYVRAAVQRIAAQPPA
jgi:uncharacterized protein YecE (DUF72 family)